MSDDSANKPPNQKTILGHAAPRTARKTPATVVGRAGLADAAKSAKDAAGGGSGTLPQGSVGPASVEPPNEDYCGYKLVDKIAEGGMGVVYLGEHTTLGRRGAIKILKREFCQNEEIVQRFYQEARAVNMIGHENIIEIFDFGRTSDGRVFFVMEYLEGEPLSDRLAKGAMNWHEARPVLEQVLRALNAAHAKDLVHRDLKPDNIYLRRRADGTVSARLLDFGIAKLSGLSSPAEQLTKTGALIGTPHYMSPEQIDGAANVDARTDIYSLGIILYEMFTGVLPFAGDTLAAVIRQHLLEPPPPITVAEADVPPGIAVVINRMLAKKPEERYQSIAAVASDLADIAVDKPPSYAGDLNAKFPTQHGAAPAPVQVHTPAQRMAQTEPPPVPPVPKSNMALTIIAGVAVVAAIGLGVAYFLSNRSSSEEPVAGGGSGEPVVVKEDAGPTPVADDIDLAKLTTDAQALLRQSLSETEPALRSAGASGLAVVGDRESGQAIAKLVEADPDPTVRGHAADALARLPHPGGDEVIASSYDKAPPALKVWLDEALLRFGQDNRQARRRLTRAAGDKDLGISFKAALALAELSEPGDKKAIRSLSKMAAREAELTSVAPYAGLVILTKLARLREEKARAVLIETLKNKDEAARVAAAEGLARLGDEAGRDALLAIVSDNSSPNQIVAARALVVLGDYSGFDVLSAKLESKEPAFRSEAARGLGEVGEKSSLSKLAPLLEDDDKNVRIAAAVSVLTILGLDPTVLSQASIDWAKTALASQDWATRLAAARTIGDFEQDAAMPLFAAAIVDERPDVRRVAARSARRLRGVEPARTLATAVKAETNNSVKEEQVRTLAAMREPVAKDALTEVAAGKGRVAVLASGALVAIGEVDAVTQIDEAMKSRKTEMRIAAVESAKIAADPVVIPTLVVGLRDKLFKVRFLAAEALARYKAKSDDAIAVLRDGLGDRDRTIAGRAMAALLLFNIQPKDGPSVDSLLDSDDAEERLAALDAVTSLPWAKASRLLRRALSDSSADVRREALDHLAKFASAHQDDVIPLYRQATRDVDSVVRAKAQARLARLTKPAKTGKSTPTAPTTPTGDIDELRTARDSVVAAKTTLEQSQEKLEKLVREIDEATKEPAKDEDDVDRVEKLARDVERAAKAVKSTRSALQTAVRKATSQGRGASGDEADAMREEIAAAGRAGGTAVRAAIDAGRKARRKAKQYAADETADPDLYLTSAKTAIATGKLRTARSDLRKAEKLFKARGKVNPDVYFAYGELYSKLAMSSGKTSTKIRNLKRAIQNFDRFAARGSGFRVGQAKERSAEAAAEIKALEGN